jgi:hypothetical protein
MLTLSAHGAFRKLVIFRCHLSVRCQSPTASEDYNSFHSKVNRPLDILQEGRSVTSSDHLMPGAKVQRSECPSSSHSITLSSPTHGENEIAASGPGMHSRGLPSHYIQILFILNYTEVRNLEEHNHVLTRHPLTSFNMIPDTKRARKAASLSGHLYM